MKPQTQPSNNQSKPPQTDKRLSQQSADKVGKAATANISKPPVDYQVLLLSLADEYLNAAHACGTTTSMASSNTDVEEYYKLIATGLGCLEAVLKVGSKTYWQRLSSY